MTTYSASANRQAIALAFRALNTSIDHVLETSAYDAHPGYGIEGDIHFKAIAEPDINLFERLAGLAYAGIALIESDREWFLSEGLRAANCYDFWYTLALTIQKAAHGHIESERPAGVPDVTVLSLFQSLQRFVPYSCVQPGDCAMRTADALILLCKAFRLDDMRLQLRNARFSSSSASSLLDLVDEKVEEWERASQHRGSDQGEGRH